MLFPILLTIVIIQRLAELWIARRNENWIIKQGGFEIGGNHYKYIVGMHTLFFISLIGEVVYFDRNLSTWWWIPFSFFVAAQFLRVWSISSLGYFWNTKIMILPGADVVAKGPYKFMRHPNYVIVATEILVLPLIFQAYATAVIFTILNIAILSVRIRIEEWALSESTNYEEHFKWRSRFIPKGEN